jgi:hypothetical protein
METYIGIPDLIRRGYYETELSVRNAIKARRLPPHKKIGGKIKWRESAIKAWFTAGSIVWIPRGDQ